ncbi:phospholipase A1 member A-like [Lampetra planeri]
MRGTSRMPGLLALLGWAAVIFNPGESLTETPTSNPISASPSPPPPPTPPPPTPPVHPGINSTPGPDPPCADFKPSSLSELLFGGTELDVRFLLFPPRGSSRHPLCALPLRVVVGGGGGEGGGVEEHEDDDVETMRLIDPGATTFVLIHGYSVGGVEPRPIWLDEMVSELLAATPDTPGTNIIAVDWNRGATNWYPLAVQKTREAGRIIANMITTLMVQRGVRAERVHLVGVSLGAHVAGFTGSYFSGRIAKITALDPAGPKFSQADPAERLDSSDAAFVDVVHTDGDKFGIRRTLGHVDFYVNGGEDQPGCPKTTLTGGFTEDMESPVICDHMRAVRLWLSSLRSACELRAFPCDSAAALAAGRCLECRTERTASCPRLGLHSADGVCAMSDSESIVLHMNTAKAPPYCVTYYLAQVESRDPVVRGSLFVRLHANRSLTEEVAVVPTSRNFMEGRSAMRLLFVEGLPGPLVAVTFRFRGPSFRRLFISYRLHIARLVLSPWPIRNGESYCTYNVSVQDGAPALAPLEPCNLQR